MCTLINGVKYEGVLEDGSFKTPEKHCRNCGKMKTYDEFDEGKELCKICLENKRKYRNKHKETNNDKQRATFKEDE